MSFNSKNKNGGNDFNDILETSDNNDYLKFCTDWGPLYAKSFSFLMLTNFFFFSLTFISKFFTIFIVLNLITWNSNMHMDWDEEHGQLDDSIVEFSENDIDPYTNKPIIDPLVMFFYLKSGLIVNDFRQLITYSYILSFYENEKFYDNSFKIINCIDTTNFYIIINENKKLIYKNKIDINYLIKKSDYNLFMNYKYKNNVIFKNDIILDLFKINTNVSDLVINNYYNKKLYKKKKYIQSLPYNFYKCFNAINNWLKKNY